MSSDPDDFLIVPEAAAELRMAKRTLDNHRWRGTGPKFRRHGGRIVYRRGDLLAWSEERAARMAAGKKSSRASSSERTDSSGPRAARTRLDKRKRPKTAVESQPKHTNRSLRADKANAIKGSTGGHPTP
jgi:predicted DNA-binding transcriptional regulator AlpA